MGLPPSRRRASNPDTAHAVAEKACRQHLKDLRRAHSQPPQPLVILSRSVPGRVAAEPWASFCTSPAQLCAELAE
jgi:hypothetical protein